MRSNTTTLNNRLNRVQRQAARTGKATVVADDYPPRPQMTEEEVDALFMVCCHSDAKGGRFAAEMRPDAQIYPAVPMPNGETYRHNPRGIFNSDRQRAMEHGWIDEAGNYLGDPHGHHARYKAIDAAMRERITPKRET